MPRRFNAFARFFAARRAPALASGAGDGDTIVDRFARRSTETQPSRSAAATGPVDRTAGTDEAVEPLSTGFFAPALTDAMPQMVWSTRVDGHHDYFNRQWYLFTGATPGTTDGESWNGMFHADDRERAWTAWRHSLATGEPYEIEYRLRHHAGGYRWTLGRALPIRLADGTITRWIGTCTDIDDRKLAEERHELLSLEMSHRIKNLLAVVSALIGLEARDASSAVDLAKTIQTKIAALAAAHTLVSKPNNARMGTNPSTLHAMLAGIVEPYQDAADTRIIFTGDDCPVGSEAATALALVFHELATNAVKYGALMMPNGVVRLTTRVDADRVSIDWQEDGGPVILETPARSGFGTRLTEVTLTQQLNGSIERRWGRNGLLVLIRIDRRTLTSGVGKSAYA